MTYKPQNIKKVVINSGVGKMVNARKGKETTEGDEDTIKDLISDLQQSLEEKLK